VRRHDFRSALFSASAILKDETLDLLSSVGPIVSREHLTGVLAGQWKWEAKYGDALYSVLSGMDIPPLRPLPKKPRGSKRGAESDAQGSSRAKRSRTNMATMTSAESSTATTSATMVTGTFTFQMDTYNHSQTVVNESEGYNPYANAMNT
jgi:hypothetical protein